MDEFLENYLGGMEQTKRFEGWRNSPYDDAGGKAIGYGFNLDYLDPKYHKSITKEQAQPIFEEKYLGAIDTAERFLGEDTFNGLSQTRKNVVVDMAYNLGNGLFDFKDFKTALINEDYDEAAKEMKDSKWYKQVGNRSKELVSEMKKGEDKKTLMQFFSSLLGGM